MVIRYADDFVIGFEHQNEARRCLAELHKRFAKFGFLGFTHVCAYTLAHGRFVVHRYSIAKRVRATLAKIKQQLRRRLHRPLGETGRWLGRVVTGWLNYHAVPFNNDRIDRFVNEVGRLWLMALRRRSQRGRSRWTWERFGRLAAKYLPRPTIKPPYPHQRFNDRLKAGAV